MRRFSRGARPCGTTTNLLIGRDEYVSPLLTASLAVEEAQYQDDPLVLDVHISNRSDAAFRLYNQDEYTFHAQSDLVALAPHDTPRTRLRVKLDERLGSITLTFEVLNAIVAPDQHPTITFDVQASAAE